MKPNIILINCDDLGYGDIEPYGSVKNKTPYLSQMAAEGMRFTDFYQASPVCSPSRGAMMTGCYPPRIGFGSFDGQWVLFPGQGVGLSSEEKTIAELLKEAGYSTMLVGKWHCGDQPEFLPTRHGFDHYYGLPFSNDMGRQAGHNYNFPPLPLLQDDEVIELQPDQRSLTERYVEKSVDFIRKNADKPFFLYLAHMHVHLPLYAAARFMQQSANGAYGACVEAIDWATGVIMNELKRLGIDDNTIVCFTSDNGCRGDNGGSNYPLRGKKGTTWEGGMRLPFIVRWPGKIPAGSECGEIAASIDLLPTFCKLAGVQVPEERIIDGVDISSLLLAENPEKPPREKMFYYISNNLEAVRRGKWKLHVRKGKNEISELYDLSEDISESENLYDLYPDVVAELLSELVACRHDMGDAATGIEGENVRPIGRVDNPAPLTEYDENYPYIEALYDLSERG
jgi:arylsulfatase A